MKFECRETVRQLEEKVAALNSEQEDLLVMLADQVSHSRGTHSCRSCTSSVLGNGSGVWPFFKTINTY